MIQTASSAKKEDDMSARMQELGAGRATIVDIASVINAPRSPTDMDRGMTPAEDVRLRREPGM